MYRHIRQNCKIANSEGGMEKLFEHTLQRQNRELQAEVAEVKAQVKAQSAQVAELTALLKGQLAVAPQGGANAARPAVERATVVNTGPTTNIAQSSVQNVAQQTIINIVPWDGERRISVGAAEIARAFAENERLQEYVRWPDRDLADQDLAPPYVTELFVDLTKRAHEDPATRNVYLNPRRADQVLVLMKSGRWEVLPLATATRLLLDGVATSIGQTMMTAAELKQLPLEAQNAASLAKMMYQGEPEEYVQRAKAPMTAHLANAAPSSLEAK